ncbi:MAG: ParB/RepB/Spo0J family partition protein [Methylococcaceae bacterium]
MIASQKKSALPGGLGLENMGDLSALLDQPMSGGGPLELELHLIDEDPNQPRTVFDSESLGEMAETIRVRGVKTPISVRPHPEDEGRYVINHGARRYRASTLAGKKTIPGFIDADYTEADQVIENLQRDSLTAREIADFIGREIAKGKKKGVIAKAIGKSPAFVTQHVTLLDLPDPIAEVFNSGRCHDVTVINELVTVYKKEPQEVCDWMNNDKQGITRGSVKLLREYLDNFGSERDEDGLAGGTDDNNQEEDKGVAKKDSIPTDPNKLKKAIVLVQHDDRPARILLTRRPPADGFAWLKYEDDGEEFEANLATVQLVSIIEA